MISEDHGARPDRGGDPEDFRPMGADERDVDAAGDQRFERRVGGRLAKGVEPPAFSELAEAGDRAGLGHARQAEIEPVGEEARHENARVDNRLAAPQMGEAVGEQSPTGHLREQVGDTYARQHRIEACSHSLGFRSRRFLDWCDLQQALLDRDIRQQPALRLCVDCRQPLVEQGSTLFTLSSTGSGNPRPPPTKTSSIAPPA